MKGMRLAAVLLAALTLWALPAQAEGSYSAEGQKWTGTLHAPYLMVRQVADSLPYTLVGTAGVPDVNVTDRDRDNVVLFPNAILSDSIAYNAADSTGVLDVHDLRHLKLLIKATPIGAATAGATVRLGIQFRECLYANVDSMSSFVEYAALGWPDATAANDTLNIGHVTTGSTSAAWSGEYVVTVALNRSAAGSAVAATAWAYPNGIAVLADRIFGSDAWWNRLQIRVRNLGGGKKVRLAMHVLGVSQ